MTLTVIVVIDVVHDAVCQRLLDLVLAVEPCLLGQESRDAHGLPQGVAVVFEDGKLAEGRLCTLNQAIQILFRYYYNFLLISPSTKQLNSVIGKRATEKIPILVLFSPDKYSLTSIVTGERASESGAVLHPERVAQSVSA